MGCTHSGYFAGEFLSTSSAGRTTDLLGVLASPTKVSIHVLREEDDEVTGSNPVISSNFYPRPPRGGRRGGAGHQHGAVQISIHVLREEDDGNLRCRWRGCLDFYPRPPRGGRPVGLVNTLYLRPISIHVLREEDDLSPGAPAGGRGPDFYPRPPRGGRPNKPTPAASHRYFYPRPPRGGRRPPGRTSMRALPYFYPRPPRGGRLHVGWPDRLHQGISIHVLREEDDQSLKFQASQTAQFLSTSSARRTTTAHPPRTETA